MDLWILLKRDTGPVLLNSAHITQIIAGDHNYTVNTTLVGREFHITQEEFNQLVERLGGSLIDLSPPIPSDDDYPAQPK